MTVVTAVTAQNTCGVRQLSAVAPELVAAQIDAVVEDIGVDAIKIGMLGNAEVVEVVAERLEAFPPTPTVVDPVLVSSSGTALLEAAGVEALVTRLLPLSTLVTPNLPELERLTGSSVTSVADRYEAARKLAPPASAVLVTGGHEPVDLEGERQVLDLLYDGERFHRFTHPFIVTKAMHGTGCTLSAAIATFLAAGERLERAVEEGRAYVRQALATALPLGQGQGLLNHATARRDLVVR